MPYGAPAFTTTKVGISSGVTTDAVDSSSVGANGLIVVSVGFYNVLDPVPVLTDSKVNSWSGLTVQNGNVIANRLFYCFNPIVGIGHTFTLAGSAATYPGISVAGWPGSVASPFDQQNGGAASTGSTQATGSVTPSEANELVIAGLGHDDNSGAAVSIGGGFTAINSASSPGNAVGSGLAYLIQTSAVAANPTWNITNSAPTGIAATIATFKAGAGGGGGGGVVPKMTQYYR